jgi:hypothetical protein
MNTLKMSEESTTLLKQKIATVIFYFFNIIYEIPKEELSTTKIYVN